MSASSAVQRIGLQVHAFPAATRLSGSTRGPTGSAVFRVRLQVGGGAAAAGLTRGESHAVAATANLAGGTSVAAGIAVLVAGHEIRPAAVAAGESGLRTLTNSVAAGLA